MKLIDKDALVAEIERRKQVAFGWLETAPNDAIEAEFELCDDILSFLDTLELKEVDLDKEIEQSFTDLDYHLDAYNRVEDYVGENIDMVEYERIAKHFFELGLKAAQKGE